MIGFILGFVAAIGVIFFLYFKASFIKYGNPVNTVNYDGFLGFKLGDSRELVVSRIKHLKLFSEEEKQLFDFMTKNKIDNDCLSTSNKLYNNIKGITFFTRNNKLTSMYFSLFDEQGDINSIVEVVTDILKRRLGEPKENRSGCLMWESGYKEVVFAIDNKEINDVCVFINDKRI